HATVSDTSVQRSYRYVVECRMREVATPEVSPFLPVTCPGSCNRTDIDKGEPRHTAPRIVLHNSTRGGRINDRPHFVEPIPPRPIRRSTPTASSTESTANGVLRAICF